ncbi:hypothetical protein KUCAC02_020825, partial [Chaenocephalus aceratus]
KTAWHQQSASQAEPARGIGHNVITRPPVDITLSPSSRAACPPAAVISWLSSGKETAKQGTVYLCRLYSLHIPAAGLRHHSNLPGSAEKRPADLLSTTVCRE